MVYRMDRSYKNRPKNLAREVGRIARDVYAEGQQRLRRVSSNFALPAAPITTSEGAGSACCCDRTLYVSLDGAGDFPTISEALAEISSYESPSANTPWIVFVCPGEYHEDVVGVDWVSIVGIGTKRDGARVIGVDGPVFVCPDSPISVENISFSLAVDVSTVSPVVISAIDVPAVLNETHIFSNCQISMTVDASRTGRLVQVSGTGILFEHCDFVYESAEETIALLTHELFKFASGSVPHFISCDIRAGLVSEDDNLYVFSETADDESGLMVKDCRARIHATHANATGTNIFYYAVGEGEHKYLQDNHIEFRSAVAFSNFAYFVHMAVADSIVVVSNNNTVLFYVDSPWIVDNALTNTFDSHHDFFNDQQRGFVVPYANAGTINFVHAPAPGIERISQHQDILIPPGGSFYLPGNQAGLVAGAWRLIFINTVDWQKGGTAPTAPLYRFLPGVIGEYLVIGSAHFVAGTVTDGAEYRVGLALNGTVIKYCDAHSGSAAFLGANVQDIIQVTSVTDFIDLRIFHTSGVNQTVRGSRGTTWLSAIKVS